MTKRPRGGARKPSLEEQRQAAAAVAVRALTFIATEPERLGRFLALTGIGPEAIRAAAREPDFLLGVLEHLMSDESLLLEFANQNEIDPEDVARARDVLAGGHSETS